MAINTTNPLAYELLSTVIQEFEQQMLESEKREAFLAATNGPLTSMELALDGSEKALTKVKKARDGTVDENGEPKKKRIDEIMVDMGVDVEMDQDMLALMGGENNPVQNYLEDCLGCNLRLQFDWQLQPFALLGPINAFIDDILETIERLKQRLNPANILADLCMALNLFEGFCIQDLIMLIMALKLLLKKYLLQLFNIKIDWTLLLGPLLKFILEAIATLLEQIVGIILAPIDCVLAALYTTNTLIKQTAGLINDVAAFGAGLMDIPKDLKAGKLPLGMETNLTFRDAKWLKKDDGKDIQDVPNATDDNGVPDPGYLQTRDHFDAEEKIQDSTTFPTGFDLRSDMTMEEALRDPLFSERSTILEKIIVPVQDARNWIRELFDNIIEALLSLRGLVSGSLALSLDFIGILLFLLDLIGLVFLIMSLLKSGISIKDWCSHLQENPEKVEQLLTNRFPGVRAVARGQGVNAEIELRQGPAIIGTIKTCASQRTSQDAQILQQWIRDLQVDG
jgi:hypothetical protein